MNSLGNENRFGAVTEKQMADVSEYFAALSWPVNNRVEKFSRFVISPKKTVYKSNGTCVMKEFVSGTRFREYVVPEEPGWTFHAVTRHVVVYSKGDTAVELVAETRPTVRTISVYFTRSDEVSKIIDDLLDPIKVYAKLTGTRTFAGKPRRSALTNRSVLEKKNYSVTGTYGERHLFYIDAHGVLSFVTRNMEFIRIRGEKPRADYADTLIDGEIVNGTFYAHDVLFTKGKDFRGSPFENRLNKVFEILMGLRLQLLRVNVVYLEKGSDIHEFPGNKRSQFSSLTEAAKSVWGRKPKSLLFTPRNPQEPTFEWVHDISFPKEYVLKTSLETFFETREKLEKLLLEVHKCEKFVGRTVDLSKVHVGSIKNLKLLGQKGVDFDKFTQIMNKWHFKLVEKTSDGAITHFEFEKIK
jgi:hypothetical protein